MGGNVFYKKISPHPLKTPRSPRETRRSRFERKRRSKGADGVFAAGGNGERRTGGELPLRARETPLGDCGAAGGKCFFGNIKRWDDGSRRAAFLLPAGKKIPPVFTGGIGENAITERCQRRSCSKPAPPSWWRSRTRCRTRRRPSRSCRSERYRRRHRKWRCGDRR